MRWRNNNVERTVAENMIEDIGCEFTFSYCCVLWAWFARDMRWLQACFRRALAFVGKTSNDAAHILLIIVPRIMNFD